MLGRSSPCLWSFAVKFSELRNPKLEIQKNISNLNVFWKSSFEEFMKSEKLLQILIKLLNPRILFCKSHTSLQIQELLLNPKTILQI